MQASKIETGKVYWHDTASTWREYSSMDAYPIVFRDVATRWHKPNFSRTFHQHPTGKWLAATIAEPHHNAGKAVYVRPGSVRAPLEQAQAEMDATRAERSRENEVKAAAREKASDAANALHARLSTLELPGYLEQPLSHRDGVRLNLSAEQANALVAILGASEQRFQAGYEEGQRDAEAEHRRQLGYISVEEEAERDRQTAARRAAERCPAGRGCSGAAFPGHPAHPQLVPDDALPDANERALQRGLGA